MRNHQARLAQLQRPQASLAHAVRAAGEHTTVSLVRLHAQLLDLRLEKAAQAQVNR